MAVAATVVEGDDNHRTFSLTLCILAVSQFGAAQTQKTFPSAEAAADALIGAAQTRDVAQVAAIFGPQKNVLMSGDADPTREKWRNLPNSRRKNMNSRPDPMNHDRMVLMVGSQDWPFPVPLVRTNGQWRFDAAEGAFEMRARRIGANELDAIEICSGYVEAQRSVSTVDHNGDGIYEYAQRIMSTSGKQDGLYWPGAAEPLVPQSSREHLYPCSRSHTTAIISGS